MKNTQLKKFNVFYFTPFGVGVHPVKASSFQDAYNRLNAKRKKLLQSIVDDDGNEANLDDIKKAN